MSLVPVCGFQWQVYDGKDGGFQWDENVRCVYPREEGLALAATGSSVVAGLEPNIGNDLGVRIHVGLRREFLVTLSTSRSSLLLLSPSDKRGLLP